VGAAQRLRANSHDAVGLLGLLDRDDGVGAGRHWGTGHDADRGAPRDLRQLPRSGAHLTDDRQLAWRVRGVERKAVHRRIREWRNVDGGGQLWLDERPSARIRERHDLPGA
jgi:hypothetical protein